MTESMAKAVCAQMSVDLVSIVPQVDDHLCPICFTIYWKPIRMKCKHVFCIRCTVLMQRQKKKFCPLCREDVIMLADTGMFPFVRLCFCWLLCKITLMLSWSSIFKNTFPRKQGRNRLQSRLQMGSNSMDCTTSTQQNMSVPWCNVSAVNSACYAKGGRTLRIWYMIPQIA